MRALYLAVAGLAASIVAVPEARAEALVAGPALVDGVALSAEDAPALVRPEVRESAYSLEFTPRNPLSLLFGNTTSEDGERAELRLGVARDDVAAERLAALGAGDVPGELPGGTLEIGGALHWSDWSMGSGYTRAELFGGEADLVQASLGWGSMRARLAYGQTERAQADTLDVWMLSTDLTAWSWLTLETDVAVGASAHDEDEGLAVGRLGVRLNF